MFVDVRSPIESQQRNTTRGFGTMTTHAYCLVWVEFSTSNVRTSNESHSRKVRHVTCPALKSRGLRHVGCEFFYICCSGTGGNAGEEKTEEVEGIGRSSSTAAESTVPLTSGK